MSSIQKKNALEQTNDNEEIKNEVQIQTIKQDIHETLDHQQQQVFIVKREQMQPNEQIKQNIDEKGANNGEFFCNELNCNKYFKQKKSLLDHRRIHAGCRPYHCTWQNCDKKFTQFSSLQKHERIHKGEKPYICTFAECNHAFTQISNLKRHLRVHTKEKPYKCKQCEKAFNTTSNLKQHEQIHKTQFDRIKFECTQCDKFYFYTSNLKKHIQLHQDQKMQVLQAQDCSGGELPSQLKPSQLLESGNINTNNSEINQKQNGNTNPQAQQINGVQNINQNNVNNDNKNNNKKQNQLKRSMQNIQKPKKYKRMQYDILSQIAGQQKSLEAQNIQQTTLEVNQHNKDIIPNKLIDIKNSTSENNMMIQTTAQTQTQMMKESNNLNQTKSSANANANQPNSKQFNIISGDILNDNCLKQLQQSNNICRVQPSPQFTPISLQQQYQYQQLQYQQHHFNLLIWQQQQAFAANPLNRQVLQNANNQNLQQRNQFSNVLMDNVTIMHNHHIDFLINGLLYLYNGEVVQQHELEESLLNPVICDPVRCCNQDNSLLQNLTQTQINSINQSQNQGIVVKGEEEAPEQQMIQTNIQAVEQDKNKYEDIINNRNKQQQMYHNQQQVHQHSINCGHIQIIHAGHIDYLVDNMLHFPHNDHCDNHGPIQFFNKNNNDNNNTFVEQKTINFQK